MMILTWWVLTGGISVGPIYNSQLHQLSLLQLIFTLTLKQNIQSVSNKISSGSKGICLISPKLEISHVLLLVCVCPTCQWALTLFILCWTPKCCVSSVTSSTLITTATTSPCLPLPQIKSIFSTISLVDWWQSKKLTLNNFFTVKSLLLFPHLGNLTRYYYKHSARDLGQTLSENVAKLVEMWQWQEVWSRGYNLLVSVWHQISVTFLPPGHLIPGPGADFTLVLTSLFRHFISFQ